MSSRSMSGGTREGQPVIRVLYAKTNSNEKHIAAHSCKENPKNVDPDRVVEAFGFAKCPKLMEQLKKTNITVRIATLGAVADTLHNPNDVVSCINAGVLDLLIPMLQDEDPRVRHASSKALAIGLANPLFRSRFLQDAQAIQALKEPLNNANGAVRINVYKALHGISRTRQGASALVIAGYIMIFVTRMEKEDVGVQEVILQTLHACVNDMKGVQTAMANKAVELCIRLLGSTPSSAVRKEAGATLALLCFVELAKEIAINNRAISVLSKLILDPDSGMRASAASALMAITTTDDGKKEILPSVPKLMRLLDDKHDLVVVNGLKVLANAAVHPEARRLLREDSGFVGKLEALMKGGHSEIASTPLIQEHAKICHEVVLWRP